VRYVSYLPSDENGVVMVKAEVMTDGVGQLVAVIIQRSLPAAEARQSLVCVVVDLQLRLLVYTHR